MSVNEEEYERQVTCDEAGCDHFYFISSGCTISDKELDAVGVVLGWVFPGEDRAYCPHCKPPDPKKKVKATP